ncbi:hypothetical protein TRVA0_052S01134 [Trichomonascus vanleenenianus]|uniref:uncharacterized protein n=1 Tax=Trichomonascus vanleenenianus TaxID=2268995 RepID=UPI003ECB2C7B
MTAPSRAILEHAIEEIEFELIDHELIANCYRLLLNFGDIEDLNIEKGLEETQNEVDRLNRMLLKKMREYHS